MKRHSGYTMIEALTYIACLTIILTVAYPTYHRFIRGSDNLRHNADDIVRAVNAGERWRAATGPVRTTGERFVIPQRNGEIAYTVSDGVLWRESGDGQRIAALRGVKSSTMLPDARPGVTAWRWELELMSGQKIVPLRPLFTFQAVAGGQS